MKTVIHNDVEVTIEGYNDHIYKHIGPNFYEHEMLEFIEQRNRPGIYVDIGANIGNHTLFFSNIMKKDVIAFEPYAFNYLKMNVEANHCQYVECIKEVLADGGSYDLVEPPSDNKGMAKYEKGSQIKSDRLDDYGFSNIGVIKIDTEGMEQTILENAIETLIKSRPDVYVEGEPQILKDLGYKKVKTFNWTPTHFYKW